MSELLLLRLVHVLAGIFWLGAGLLTTIFLAPVLSAAGPAGGAIMQRLRQRGLMDWMLGAALVTLLSGVRLLWISSAGFSGAYLSSGMGRAFAWAGASALVAFAIAMLVGRPAQARAGQLAVGLSAAADADRPRLEREIASLRRRGALGSTIATALLTLSAAGMSVARYL